MIVMLSCVCVRFFFCGGSGWDRRGRVGGLCVWGVGGHGVSGRGGDV